MARVLCAHGRRFRDDDRPAVRGRIRLLARFLQRQQRGAADFPVSQRVQLGCVLAGCPIILAPLQSWAHLGGLILACGVFGLIYSAIGWRGTVRDGVSAKIDLEDRIWYAAAPAVAYFLEAGAGVALILQLDLGCAALAVALSAMLLVAVHNAWDITIWSVTRRGD